MINYIQFIKTLTHHRVEFIIVGGVCAVLHGAPVTTYDLDIVHLRAPDNIDRLIMALNELDAVYRGRGDQRLKPQASHLAGDGHFLLNTHAGPLDVLSTIGQGHSYQDLLPRTMLVTIESYTLHILKLADLIAIKRESIRDKDKYGLIILEQVLEQRK